MTHLLKIPRRIGSVLIYIYQRTSTHSSASGPKAAPRSDLSVAFWSWAKALVGNISRAVEVDDASREVRMGT